MAFSVYDHRAPRRDDEQSRDSRRRFLCESASPGSALAPGLDRTSNSSISTAARLAATADRSASTLRRCGLDGMELRGPLLSGPIRQHFAHEPWVASQVPDDHVCGVFGLYTAAGEVLGRLGASLCVNLRSKP